GVDVRVEVVTVSRDNVKTSARDPIVVSDNGDTPPMVLEVILEPIQEERAVEVREGIKVMEEMGMKVTEEMEMEEMEMEVTEEMEMEEIELMEMEGMEKT
ncbi:hypothetical protein Tco_0406205, partial [Tanacetum coccineum]